MSLELYNKYKLLLNEYDELKDKFELINNSSLQFSNCHNTAFEFFDSLDVSIVTFADEKIRYINASAAKLIGVEDVQILLEHSIFEIIAPEAHSLAKNSIISLLSGSKIEPSESVIIRKDNQEKIEVLISLSQIIINAEVQIVSIIIDNRNQVNKITNYQNIRRRLDALYSMQEIVHENEEDLISTVLEEAVNISDSEVGFFAFVNEKKESLKLGIWSSKTTKYCTAMYENHYPVAQAGIWANCLKTGETYIENDYKNALFKNGLPDGHFPLNRFISSPIIHDNQVVAVVAVGNKLTDYESDDAEQLSTYFHNMWSTIVQIRLEKEIQKSEKLHRTITSNIPDSLIVLISAENTKCLDNDGTNPVLNELTNSFNNDTLSLLLNANDYKRYEEAMLKSKSGYESNIICRIEEWILKFHFIPNKDSQTKTNPSLLIIIQDISEIYSVESKLNQSENQYKTLVDSLIDGLIIVFDKKIVFANSKIMEISGRSEENIIGLNFTELYPLKESIRIYEYYYNNSDNKLAPTTYGTSIQNVTGEIIPVEQNANTIYYNDSPAILISIRDISERIQSRAAVDKLSLIAEQTPNGIIITDQNGNIEFANSSFEDMSGYTKEEIYGKNPSLFKSGNTSPKVYQEMWKTINTGKKWQGELQNKKKSGELYWEDIIIFSIKDANKAIVNFIALQEDITEKKSIEQRILQSNTNLKMLNECYITLLNAETIKELFYSFCDIAINISGIESAIIIEEISATNDEISIVTSAFSSLNPNFELTQNSQSNFKINNCKIYRAIKDRQIAECMHENSCDECNFFINGSKDKYITTMPISNNHYQDSQIIFIANKPELINEDKIYLLQELVNYLNFGLDILFEKISRRRAEELHLLEKEQLDITLSSINDGVISIDRDNTITYINRAALKILDKEIEDCLNQSFFTFVDFYDESDNKIYYNPYDYLYVMENEPLAKTRFTVKRSKGGMKYVNINVSKIIDRSDAFIGIVIVLKDISKLVKIEAQSALSQKMESVGQLASGIAHEINSPMQFVGDNTFFINEAFELLIKYINNIHNYDFSKSNFDVSDFKSMIDAMYLDYDLEYLCTEVPIAINRTLEGIDRVRKIVSAMKNFAHSSGKSKSQANINQGIVDTVSISRNEWKNIAVLELDLDESMPLVYCSIDELNQVVLNMIINSSQAIIERQEIDSGHKGKIKLETTFDSEYVSIIVQDNGIGIIADKLNRVFDPFYTTKEIGKGTGQGLAIAHDIIVNKHKGLIEIESEYANWTRFTIKIPLAIS